MNGALRVTVMAVLVVAATFIGCTAQEGRSCVDGYGQAGTCTSIRSCPPLLQLLRSVNTPGSNALQILRRSICQIRGKPLVCCASTRVTPSRPPVTSPPAGDGGGPLPSRCGITGLTDRIVDGEDAPLLAWPWMVLLRGRVLGQRSSWFCGGVLISERYVLTAAHCFKPSIRTELEFVRVGEHTLSKNPDCQPRLCAPEPQDIRSEQIILHPQYGSPCNECNDIALIRLATPAVFHSVFVGPVCLPINPLRDMGFSEDEFNNKFGWAAGWGSTARDPNRPVTPDVLQQVLLPIREGSFCRSLRSGYPDPRSTLCAGGEGKDTCRGDSGGPLLLSNTGETKRFVVGITSLGPSVCGARSTQGLYTSVHYYVPWILSNLRP